MAKTRLPRLTEMRIRPSENGGHNVSHEFEAKPRFSKGSLAGGMFMDRPPAKEYNFGPKDGQSLMKHIAGALAIKGLMAENRAGGGGAGESPGEEDMYENPAKGVQPSKGPPPSL